MESDEEVVSADALSLSLDGLNSDFSDDDDDMDGEGESRNLFMETVGFVRDMRTDGIALEWLQEADERIQDRLVSSPRRARSKAVEFSDWMKDHNHLLSEYHPESPAQAAIMLSTGNITPVRSPEFMLPPDTGTTIQQTYELWPKTPPVITPSVSPRRVLDVSSPVTVAGNNSQVSPSFRPPPSSYLSVNPVAGQPVYSSISISRSVSHSTRRGGSVANSAIIEAQERARRRVSSAHSRPKLIPSKHRKPRPGGRKRSIKSVTESVAEVRYFPTVDSDLKVLSSLVSPWSQRLQSLINLHNLLREGWIPQEETHEVARVLAVQLRDQRPAIIRHCTTVLSQLGTSLGEAFAEHCVAILPLLLALLGSASAVLHSASRTCLQTFVRCCAPLDCLGTLLAAAQSKVRDAVTELVSDLLLVAVTRVNDNITLLGVKSSGEEVKLIATIPWGGGHEDLRRMFAKSLSLAPSSIRLFHKAAVLADSDPVSQSLHRKLETHKQQLVQFITVQLTDIHGSLHMNTARCFWLTYLIFPSEAVQLYSSLEYNVQQLLHQHRPSSPSFVVPDSLALGRQGNSPSVISPHFSAYKSPSRRSRSGSQRTYRSDSGYAKTIFSSVASHSRLSITPPKAYRPRKGRRL